MSNVNSIEFRMYNTGSVGDCLLLLFKKDKKITFRMMIDCGGWNTNSTVIKPCVEDIRTFVTINEKGDVSLSDSLPFFNLISFNIGIKKISQLGFDVKIGMGS